MLFKKHSKTFFAVVLTHFVCVIVFAQPGVPFTKWTPDGGSYYQVEKGEIVKIELPSQNKTVFISKKQLISGKDTIAPRSFQLSADGKQAMIYTKAQKV